MSSSSTLVNVAEDAEQRLVRLLAETAKSGSFVQDCESCITNADACQLLKTIIADTGALGALFVLEPPDEAVSAFSLLTALLVRVGKDRPAEEAGLVKLLADAVTKVTVVPSKDPSDVVQRQVSLLSVLYNMRSLGTEKCSLLARMIQLAATSSSEKKNSTSSSSSSDLLEAGKPLGDILHEDMSPEQPRMVAMLDAWQVPLKDRREIYLAAAQSVPVDSPRKQRFLLLFVETYNGDAVSRKNTLQWVVVANDVQSVSKQRQGMALCHDLFYSGVSNAQWYSYIAH